MHACSRARIHAYMHTGAREASNEAQRQSLQTELLAFVSRTGDASLDFPPSMNSYERRLVSASVRVQVRVQARARVRVRVRARVDFPPSMSSYERP